MSSNKEAITEKKQWVYKWQTWHKTVLYFYPSFDNSHVSLSIFTTLSRNGVTFATAMAARRDRQGVQLWSENKGMGTQGSFNVRPASSRSPFGLSTSSDLTRHPFILYRHTPIRTGATWRDMHTSAKTHTIQFIDIKTLQLLSLWSFQQVEFLQFRNFRQCNLS